LPLSPGAIGVAGVAGMAGVAGVSAGAAGVWANVGLAANTTAAAIVPAIRAFIMMLHSGVRCGVIGLRFPGALRSAM